MIVEALGTRAEEGLDFPELCILNCLHLALRLLDRPAQDAHIGLHGYWTLTVIRDFELDFKCVPGFLKLDTF